MKQVSASWEQNQNAVLQAKNNVRLFVLNKQIIADDIYVDSGNCKIYSKNAFGMYFDSNGGKIIANYNEAQSNLAMAYYKMLVGSMRVEFYDGNYGSGTMVSSIVINPSQEMVSCLAMNFKSIVFTATVETDVRFFALGSAITFIDKDVFNLSYDAHIDILNRDLPYQKLTFTINNIKKTYTYLTEFPKNMPLYAEIGVKGEYIMLGCGYYYLSNFEAKANGLEAKFEFVDTISTMSDKYRFGNMANNYTLGDLYLYALGQYAQIVKYPKNVIANYKDFSNINKANLPNDRTNAEVLQMIAQASNTILHLDSENQIEMLSFDFANLSVYDYDTKNIISFPEYSKQENTRSIFIKNFYYPNGASSGDVGGGYWSSSNDAMVDLSGVHSSYTTNYGTIESLYSTYNFVYLTTTNTTPFTITASTFSLKEGVSYYQEVNKNGTSDFSLSLELLHKNNDLTQIGAYCYEWLRRNIVVDIETRINPAIELLDVIKFDGQCICITDISYSYNGGLSGTMKGTVVSQDLIAPVISMLTYDANSFSFRIKNPNNFDVRCAIYFSQLLYAFPINANQTLMINQNNYPNLLQAFQMKVDRILDYDLTTYCYVADTLYNNSENTIILEEDLWIDQ